LQETLFIPVSAFFQYPVDILNDVLKTRPGIRYPGCTGVQLCRISCHISIQCIPNLELNIFQGCGSGFSNFVDPDPYWEAESGSGSKGKKIKKIEWEDVLF
jgi:hypothetical protein